MKMIQTQTVWTKQAKLRTSQCEVISWYCINQTIDWMRTYRSRGLAPSLSSVPLPPMFYNQLTSGVFTNQDHHHLATCASIHPPPVFTSCTRFNSSETTSHPDLLQCHHHHLTVTSISTFTFTPYEMWGCHIGLKSKTLTSLIFPLMFYCSRVTDSLSAYSAQGLSWPNFFLHSLNTEHQPQQLLSNKGVYEP